MKVYMLRKDSMAVLPFFFRICLFFAAILLGGDNVYKKVTFFSSLTVLLLGVGLLLYLFFRHLSGVLLPFLLGWLLAMLSRKPAFWLHRHLGVTQGVARLFFVGVLALLFGGFIVLGVRGLLHELSLVLGRFGTEEENLLAKVREWLSSIPIIGDRLAEGTFWEDGVAVLLTALPGLLGSLADFLPSFTSDIPAKKRHFEKNGRQSEKSLL